MINMGDDCYVTYSIHRSRKRIGKMDAYTGIVNEVYVQFIITNGMLGGIATGVFAG